MLRISGPKTRDREPASSQGSGFAFSLGRAAQCELITSLTVLAKSSKREKK